MFDSSTAILAGLPFALTGRFWLLMPLVAAISLAYTASRYELTEVILKRSAAFFGKTLLAMGLIFLLLYGLSIGL